ncbi:MAG: L,D-transpeptidase [Patescibacteria group bacterium]
MVKKDRSLHLAIVILGAFLLLLFGAVFFNKQAASSFCANSISCITDLSGKKEASNEGEYMGKKVIAQDVPKRQVIALNNIQQVLGEQSGDYKHIYVDLSKQRLYAFEGTRLVYDFPVSTGKWNHTPTGDFRIWVWLRYTRMAGGDPAQGTYYNLPNVPYTMYYYNESTPKTWGYSLHGAYWHNNFGVPMSHGCTNMRIEDAGKIFYWTNPNAGGTTYPTTENPGTLITVYGETPAS